MSLNLTSGPSSDSQLVGVSCVSATSCMAVTQGVATARLSGKVWSYPSPVPLPPGSSQPGRVTGVSCKAATMCVEVGRYGFNLTQSFAALWNGKVWSQQTMPLANPQSELVLNAVSCASTTSCTAAGFGNPNPAGGADTVVTLAEHWNGKAWAIQTTPNPSGGLIPSLNGVACPSTTVCNAVGNYVLPGGGEDTLGLHY